jgi:mannitol-specific phosphotransferase system IIBC component
VLQLIKQQDLDLKVQRHQVQSCLGSLVNFIIKAATTNDTSAARNTPSNMCKNSPLGAFKPLIMKFTKEPKQDLEAATAQMETTKGKKSSVASKCNYPIMLQDHPLM